MGNLFWLLLGFVLVGSLNADEVRFYIGTSGREGAGILQGVLDSKTGKLTTPQLIAEAKGASFLAMSKDRRILYATLDLGQGNGGVGAFQLRDGQPARLLNAQPSKGTNATHVALDQKGKVLLVANYGSGSMTCFPLNPDGSIQPPKDFFVYQGRSLDPVRQEASHPHGAFVDQQNRFIYVPDLGLDKIFVYAINEDRLESLTQSTFELSPGSGPRHLAFHPHLPVAFVVNELSLTVAVLQVDLSSGQLSLNQVISSLPAGVATKSVTSSAIFCSPNGKNLYVANRGHDSLAVFAINSQGQITLIQHVLNVPATPRGFGISPDGHWLVCAGQKSGTLNAYRIDSATGKLSDTHQSVVAPAASSILFVDTK